MADYRTLVFVAVSGLIFGGIYTIIDGLGFLAAGYTLDRIEAVDMFPRTPHVEAVALLRRADT